MKKLLRVVAAFGLFLAVFVVFLLMPEGGADASVRVQRPCVTTNDQWQVDITFAVTNVGSKAIRVGMFGMENIPETPQAPLSHAFDGGRAFDLTVAPAIKPGQVQLILMRVDTEIDVLGLGGLLSPQQTWRAVVHWEYNPTRFQMWRRKFRKHASSFLPILFKQNQKAPWFLNLHTNYSPVFHP